uniref:Uncharacterized protein n=2 Tax=Acidianus TaxID=12914 RepID=A0A2U9IQ11_9CREN
MNEEEICKLVEKILREVIKKDNVVKNNNEFLKIVNQSVVSIGALQKIESKKKGKAYVYQKLLQNTNWKLLLLNKIRELDKTSLKTTFVYCYLKNREMKRNKSFKPASKGKFKSDRNRPPRENYRRNSYK